MPFVIKSQLSGLTSKYSGPNDPHNPESIPDYDDWGIDSKWLAPEWVIWHGALKAKYGKAIADYAWAQSWEVQGIGSEALNARTFDQDFRDWAKSEGLLDALYYGAGVIMKPIGTAGDVADVVVDAAQKAANAAKKALDWADYVVPIAVVVLGFAYWQATLRKIRK